MEYRITDVFYDEKEIGAVLLNFQNGDIQEGQEDQIAFDIKQEKRKNSIVAETENMSYKGVVRGHEHYNNFLMTVNRETNEATLVYLSEATLKPQLPEVETQVHEPMEVDANESNVSRIELNRKFGSKKDKRIVEQQEKMKMDINVVTNSLEKTAENVDIKEEDYSLKVNSDSDERYKPPINRDASRPEDVYDVTNIIPEHVLDSINSLALLEADLENEGLTFFVKGEVQKFQESSKRKRYRRNCGILIYIDCLLKFLSCNARVVHRKDNYSTPYSDLVSKHILETFTLASKTGRSRPISMRDKSICYVLVLAALAGDLEVNLVNLSKDLKGGIKKLQEKCRMLALSPLNSEKSVYGIKLPLPAPIAPSAPRKSK